MIMMQAPFFICQRITHGQILLLTTIVAIGIGIDYVVWPRAPTTDHRHLAKTNQEEGKSPIIESGNF